MISLFYSQNVSAIHLLGADVYYECLGNCTYRIHVTQYVDCAGLFAGPISPPGLDPYQVALDNNGNPVYDYFQATGSGCTLPSLGFDDPNEWHEEGILDITPVCFTDNGSSLCDLTGNSPYNGVQARLHYIDIELCSLSCNTVSFEFFGHHRDEYTLIYTLTNPPFANNTPTYLGGTTIYLQDAPCNSNPLPDISNGGFYACFNAPSTLDLSVIDPDGDILVYSLQPCLQDLNMSVPYYQSGSANPTTFTDPLGDVADISLNPQSGLLHITPNMPYPNPANYTYMTANMLRGQVCLYITEYRDINGILTQVGQSVRDICITMANCNPPGNTNQVPEAVNNSTITQGISNTNGQVVLGNDPFHSAIYYCEEGVLSFDFTAFDPDGTANSDLYMAYNLPAGMTGFSLTGGPIIHGPGNQPLTGHFTWSNPQSNTYTIEIIVGDDGCNSPSASVYTITLGVPEVTIHKAVTNGTSFQPGDIVEYSITVCNLSPNNISLQNIEVEDFIGGAFDWNSVTVLNLAGCTPGLLYDSVNHLLTANISSLPATPPSNCVTFCFSVNLLTDLCPQTVTNCANFSDECMYDGESCTDITVTAPAGGVTVPDSTYSNIPPNTFDNFTGVNVYIQGTFWVVTNTVFDNATVWMAPGSEIIVDKGVHLDIQNSTFQSCSEMWKNIYVQRGSLTCDSTTIRDAEMGIRINNQLFGNGAPYVTSVIVTNSEFRENFIGIYSDNLNSIPAVLYPNWTIEHNDFMGGLLRPEYPGQPLHEGYSFLGVHIDGIGVTLTENRFIALCNGIRSLRSDLFSQRNAFNNIKAGYAPNYVLPGFAGVGNFNGTAIYTRFRNSNLRVEGLGTLSTSPFSFYKCDRGIASASTRTAIYNNRMICRDAIYTTLAGPAQSYSITDNLIYCENSGIGMFTLDLASGVNVERNRIELDNTPLPGSYCISIENGGVANNTLIADDTLIVERGYAGILVNGADNLRIHHNQIEMTHLIPNPSQSLNLWGILMQNTHNAIVSCNNVTGSHTDDQFGHTALDIYDSQGWKILCNALDNTSKGIEFHGICDSKDHLLGNTMNDHYIGLRLAQAGATGNTQIASQNYTGNRWTGSYTSGNDAVCSANPGFSQFQTDGSPFYEPVNPDPPVGWFLLPSSGTNYNQCSGTFGYCGGGLNLTGDGGSTATDSLIATGNVQDSLYPVETQYSAERYLYEKLTEYPASIPDSGVFTSFYENNSETSLGAFSRLSVETRLQDFGNIPSQIEILLSQKQSLWLQKRGSDSLSHTFTDSTLIYAQWAYSDSIQGLLTGVNTQIETLMTQAEQIRNTLSADRFSRNANISDSLLIESNEKVVNAIYYSTIGIGSDSLSPAQLQAITEIAYQCPATGGKGVYKARALYRMLYGFVFFDDVGTCATQGVSWRKPKTDIHSSNNLYIKVIPNPAKEYVTIELPEEMAGIVTINNVLGVSIKSFPTQSGQTTYTLDCKDWSAGMYNVSLESIHQKIMTKLIILP